MKSDHFAVLSHPLWGLRCNVRWSS